MKKIKIFSSQEVKVKMIIEMKLNVLTFINRDTKMFKKIHIKLKIKITILMKIRSRPKFKFWLSF